MLRAKSQKHEGRVNIIGREDEAVALEDHGECYLHFQNSEIQANTFPRAGAESEVRHGVIVGCIRHPLCKSLWLEPVDIFSPYLWVMVDCQNWDVYFHSCWNCMFPNFGFSFHSSQNCEHWCIQPAGFLNYHAHLHCSGWLNSLFLYQLN